ncbi:TPA: hypothetical protein U2C46_000784 [Streptococcus suis]|nr:hypothetical protein [Streptococcus suis]
MKFFKDLKTDYLESRFSAYESFAEWFLKRKLGFWGSGKDIHDGSALTHRIMKTNIKPSLGV